MAGFTEEDYSLGPSGLLANIFGQGTQDLRGQIGGEMRAQDILEKAGSVMARPEKPAFRRENPLLDTVLGMVDKALSFDPWNQILNVNPKMQMSPMEAIANVGGAENAIFGPIRTPAQKQAVRAMWRGNPEDVMAIQADPQTLNILAPTGKGNLVRTAKAAEETGFMPEGTNAAFDPVASAIRVAPAATVGGHYQAPMNDIFTRLGITSSPLIPDFEKFRKRLTTPQVVTRPGGTADLPEAMTHEAQHFLNRNRAYGTEAVEGAPEIIDALAPYISEHGIRSAIEAGFERRNPGVAVDEMLAYLSGRGTRNRATENTGRLVHQLLKVHTAPSGNIGASITPEAVNASIRMANEASSPIYGPAAGEAWDRLAQAGILPQREGYYQARTGYKDNPLFSMRSRTEPASMYERLPRAGRTFTSSEDILRSQAGENLPPLGSAMPDIPRPVSSPGGLEFFENLRAKLGLPPADLGGMAPEFYGKKTLLESKRGGDALKEILDDWLTAHSTITGSANIPNDRFMDTVLEALARATHRGPAYEGLPQGISGFRRAITTGENMFKSKAPPHDPQKSLDILEHLRGYGLLEADVLKDALKSTRRGELGEHRLGQGYEVDPIGLERIKKLLERLGR